MATTTYLNFYSSTAILANSFVQFFKAPQPLTSQHESLELLLRLVVAVAVGGLIGWERQTAGKPAGLRTHMLVSLGAALIVLIPQQANPQVGADSVSRAIQGVATGVGFLGAGEILHQSQQIPTRKQVKGLTSAAAIWTTAALGMVVGCGLWLTGLFGVLLVWSILRFVKRLERFIPHRSEEDI